MECENTTGGRDIINWKIFEEIRGLVVSRGSIIEKTLTKNGQGNTLC